MTGSKGTILHHSRNREPIIQVSKYTFGPFELFPRSRELRKFGGRLRIRPQSYHVLLLLLEKAGEPVLREELHQRIWPSDTFVDFEHGLNSAIKYLRAVLSDSATSPKYLETLPKIGYRLIVPVSIETVRELTASDSSLGPLAENPVVNLPAPIPAATPSASSSRWPFWAAIGFLAFAALFFAIKWTTSLGSTNVRTQQEGRVMLAVLPFTNLTGDPNQDYLSDGLTEEMIEQLGQLDPAHLGVIARTSVMRYRKSNDQIAQVKRDLGVQYALEGSLRRDGDRVRVTAELIEMKRQSPIWGKKYDRELNNLLALQGEIASEIAREIRITLNANQSKAAHHATLSADAAEAYDYYLRGRYFWNKRTPQGFERAAYFFQRAIDRNPNSAQAYAGLADTFTLMTAYQVGAPKELIPKAQLAAQNALRLDEHLAEAHTSLAVIAQNYSWDWETATKEYKRAIELDPNYATAHHWYAECLALRGQFDDAQIEIDRARELDPLSLIIGADSGAILYFSRKYKLAIEQFRAVLDMEENFPRAHMIIFAMVQQKQFSDALTTLQNWRANNYDSEQRLLMMEAYIRGSAGDTTMAGKVIAKLNKFQGGQKASALTMAIAEIGHHDEDKAIRWLKTALAERSISTAVAVDPIYDPLRDDPRFKEILREMGLAQLNPDFR